ncbi:hypothetical protein GGD41_006721 [Paraburkholderia bryophila]|uniref:Uncharacterized protein n=1 Tax=Paraburkholderia bryophila TaxID=420952 RepID=A0A7Y9WGL2_9BURK|nr:hypothetical protein [Paraburkholderia bryophila]
MKKTSGDGAPEAPNSVHTDTRLTSRKGARFGALLEVALNEACPNGASFEAAAGRSAYGTWPAEQITL